ncbi:MAG: HAD family hydrolase [Armatimonadota bacterium]
MPIRALLFDLDDTLLETHHGHMTAMRVCCEQAAAAHPHWTPEQFRRSFTRAYHALESELEAGRFAYESQLHYRSVTWAQTLKECGLTIELAKELGELYLAERRKHYRLYEEAVEILERLGREYTLVLVTNGPSDFQREKIAALELERWVPHLVVSGEVGSWKPDAGIFRHALGLAGARPGEAVMVGDNLERDIAGAQAAGIHAVWMRRYPHLLPIPGITPDHEVEDLHGLVEHLERLRGSA